MFYYYTLNGNNEDVESVGGAINVKINQNVVVSNSTMSGNTEIGKYLKIDSNCFIAHKVVIKESYLLPKGTTLRGVVVINNGELVGVGAIVIPLIKIGENAYIRVGSVIGSDIEDSAKAL